MSEQILGFRLNNGLLMPAIGIGCWMGIPFAGEGDHVTEMVKKALATGYRHIDTAANYGNERSVGRALRESGVARGDIWITTKLDHKDHGRVAQALDDSLAKLGVDYVDLYLVHWPLAVDPDTGRTLQPDEHPTIADTWAQMETLLLTGKTRTIGVSNFSIRTLSILLATHTKITPAVNQVEMHPYLPQHALRAFCIERGIHLTAYSPLGKNELKEEEVLRGTSVVPKTSHEERMRENLQFLELSSEEMEAIDGLHTMSSGKHRSVCKFHSTEFGGSCFGWTYAQLGWNMTVGGVAN
ncbi:aado/keto reductase [Punctularia strigosozonata HHB-11173 SS5]|uniref:aldo/keto reductase n=1 Tax=Punctularia strigosozonata (strain HHB-11173) TaxID=741275 RepID=UPI0004416AFD|nr:aldo/keto reductase [Punctularia strigosozonata HHB-11173 SS5]EIN09222.1 aado/keto reductase [Punctularia strigosozonata HHB-11173 SS5]